MSEPEVIDVPAEEVGAELVPQGAAAATLFRTDDPSEVLERATTTANALMPVVKDKGLVVSIQGRDHLRVEAWTTLGAMLGVTPVCEWTHKLENGWEARVEARTLDGRVIGAAEAECLYSERTWKDRDDYALRSMAQTRATSKALASVLRFVATLGGASGTPAEEMGGETRESGGGGVRSDTDPATEKQRQWVLGRDGKPGLIEKANFDDEQTALISDWACHDGKLTRKGASFLIEHLKDGTAEGRTTVLQTVGWSDTPADTEGLPA